MYGLAMVVRCCVVSCVVWLNDIKQWQSKVRCRVVKQSNV